MPIQHKTEENNPPISEEIENRANKIKNLTKLGTLFFNKNKSIMDMPQTT